MIKGRTRSETLEQKKSRLLGTYPHNTWCPNCLIRMYNLEKIVIHGDQLYCSQACAVEYRISNLNHLKRAKKRK